MQTEEDRLAHTPIGFLRSSLFAAAERTVVPMLRNQPLETAINCHITASYSGPRLTQKHALVWQAVIREHRLRCGIASPEPLCIRQSDLLRAVGRDDVSTPARKWIWQKLRDMQSATIELTTPKHNKAVSYQLIGKIAKDENTGGFEIHLTSELLLLLTDELAHIDLDRKLRFKRNQLACWLHDFISTQHNVNFKPFRVRHLHDLSGSPLKMPQFRQRLREAADLLKAGDDPLLLDAHITASGLFVYNKSGTKVLLKRPEAQPLLDYRHHTLKAEEEALQRRGKVAL